MTPRVVEEQALDIANRFSFISSVETTLRTPRTVTMRFRITAQCFVQLYHNTQKPIVNYVLVLAGNRIFGRDCDGGKWHRHPFENPEAHDFSFEGQVDVSFEEFLEEVRQILVRMQIL